MLHKQQFEMLSQRFEDEIELLSMLSLMPNGLSLKDIEYIFFYENAKNINPDDLDD